MPYAWCSSKDCNYVQDYGNHPAMKARTKTIPAYTVSPEKFCGKCGSAMLTECPGCKKTRSKMDAKFCPDCGSSYKP